MLHSLAVHPYLCKYCGRAKWTGVGGQLRALAISPLTRQRLTMFVSRHRQADVETLRQLTDPAASGLPGRTVGQMLG